MKEESETLTVNAGLETEELLNFVFRSLSDPEVDEVELTRLSSTGEGVARELVTSAAVLTLSSTLLIRVLKLVERWMEQKRQRERVELIYAAAKDNAAALKLLIDLEKNMQTCS